MNGFPGWIVVPRALLVTACAQAPLTKAEVDGTIVCHPDRMDQVERTARRHNTAVYWVNCPRATLRVI
jgi:hypothetical protein